MRPPVIFTENLLIALQSRYNMIIQTEFRNVTQELKYFFDFLHSHPLLEDLLNEIGSNLPEYEIKVTEIQGSSGVIHANSELERVKICYVFLQHCISSNDFNTLINIPFHIGFRSSNIAELVSFFLNLFFVPFYNYIIERLQFTNLIVSLLHRFKFRTEWFTRKDLYEKFEKEDKKEDILNNALQLYLHDQGVDFPLSNPVSPSGKADLVTKLDLPDSPIIEVKVFDPDRNYDLSYIHKGFKQIITYANDYNKTLGSLVIFNPSYYELIVELEGNKEYNFISYGNKIIDIIVIDINPFRKSASKRNDAIRILNEKDLIND